MDEQAALTNVVMGYLKVLEAYGAQTAHALEIGLSRLIDGA
ncbi:MAG: hypothetical protein ACLSGS_04215 [Adlercreutzia sp.]